MAHVAAIYVARVKLAHTDLLLQGEIQGHARPPLDLFWGYSMSDTPRRRKAGGRDAKRAARAQVKDSGATWIDRKIPYMEVLDEEGLCLIEHNADLMLEEVGIEFSDFPEALALFKEAGADIKGERVRFPRGLCRSIIQASAPAEYMQHARNPARSTMIGGKRTVLVPAYGSPFVRDLDKGRRYATPRLKISVTL